MEVGQSSVSRSRTITEADIVQFAMFTGDWHPIHTDVVYAAANPLYGQRIAHGALVLSVALGLVEFWPPAMQAFYGLDKLRFLSPTVIGDTLRVETEVVDVSPRADKSGIVSFHFAVKNQRDVDVCVANFKALVAGTPSP